jgi:ribonuclease HI
VRVLPQDPGVVIVYTDGAARGNPGPAGIGVVVTDADGSVLQSVGEGIGVATNNVAEYRAALRGLEVAKSHDAPRVVLRSDSKLLVEQLSGRWKVKNPTLMRLHEDIRRVLKAFPKGVTFEHVRRRFNREADALANQGVDRWLAGPGRGYVRLGSEPDLFDA